MHKDARESVGGTRDAQPWDARAGKLVPLTIVLQIDKSKSVGQRHVGTASKGCGMARFYTVAILAQGVRPWRSKALGVVPAMR